MPKRIYDDIILDHNVKVPMPDGTVLRADTYRPNTKDKVPALIAWAPYSKDISNARLADLGGVVTYIAERGYGHIAMQNRGSGKSTGIRHPIFSPEEANDLCHAIEWAASQPWCDGNVGMIGVSYLSMVQFLAAAKHPPALKAIAPLAAGTDIFREATRNGGQADEFGTLIMCAFSARGGLGPPVFRHILSHVVPHSFGQGQYDARVASITARLLGLFFPANEVGCREFIEMAVDHKYDGPYYAQKSAYPRLKDIKIPVLIGTNYTSVGMHYRGAFEAWHLLETEKKMYVGGPSDAYIPWLDYHDEILSYYDHQIKGIDNGYADLPPVRYYLNGADTWKSATDWPVPGAKKTRFYLEKKSGDVFTEQSLSEEEPGSESDLSFIGIPHGMVYLRHSRRYETQILKYVTSPFERDTEVVGPVRLHLRFTSTAIDTHIMVRICDIDASGRARNVSWGWLPACFRTVDRERSTPTEIVYDCSKPEALIPGEQVVLEVPIAPTFYLFGKGHRLMLEVGSRPDLLAPDKRDKILWTNWHQPMYPARNRVFHGGSDPSFLEIDVLN
jgi:predicted acyl esterase